MGSALEIAIVALAGFIFFMWFFQWMVHLTSIAYGWWRLHRSLHLESSIETPLRPVTIIKPIKGIDDNLLKNLETFFLLDYPQYEIYFCVEDSCDPCIMIVNSLMSKYPKVNAKLYLGASKEVGVNPKIQNMLTAFKQANNDLVLISDSGMRMKPETLSHMVSFMREDTGLVHQMPFTYDRQGFPAVLEKVYFGTQHAKMYLNADLLGINCVTGMSTLFRKEVVQQAGGLESLACFLAEDFYLGQLFIDRGLRVRICSQPGLQNAGGCSVATFQSRMMRWMKLRMSLIPFTAIFLEPLSECLLLGLIVSWSVTQLFAWSPVPFFLVHCLIWFLLDYALISVVQGGPLPFSRCEFLIGWLFREITSFPLMLKAHSSRTLTWRSKKYIIHSGGIGEEVYNNVLSFV